VPAEQQPFGHAAALQPQVPLCASHACPAEQAVHVAPAVPQAVLDSLA
jgi:hypothetical protein